MKLRAYQPETDFAQLVSWVPDSRTHALWCANRIPSPLQVDSFHAALRLDAREWGSRAYVVEEDGALCGFLVYACNAESRDGFLKFVLLDPAKRGQGKGTEMICLLLEQAFAQTETGCIHLNVFDVNTVAIRCYEKAGFVQESLQEAAFPFGSECWGRCHMVARK